MNTNTEKLLTLVNEKLKEKPLIYFCKDSERATGLEHLLQNYHIACIDKGYISDSLKQKLDVHIEQNFNNNITAQSTLDLLSSDNLLTWLKNITKDNEFYAQFFQFNTPSAAKIQTLKGKLLNNIPTLNRKFEDKLSQNKFFAENNIPTPKTVVGNISELSYHDVAEDIGNEFVIQLDRAHTGLGTFFIKNENDWNKIQKNIAGNTVKFSQLIYGPTFTLNACVTSKGIFVAGLQYQITGISALTSGEGTTVGNDFSYANELDPIIKNKILNLTKSIGEHMQSDGFKGLFGVDLVVDQEGNPLIIEINARQTANIPLQTRLELNADRTPLALINLAEFLNIPIEEQSFEELFPLEGSQVFLRAKNDNFKLNHNLKSGVYRLQSDNAAKDWKSLQIKDGVILIDEDGDKPLVWQKDGYNVLDIEKGSGGLILLLQNSGSVRNKTDELARMQFSNRIVSSSGLSPWIIEALESIEQIIKSS